MLWTYKTNYWFCCSNVFHEHPPTNSNSISFESTREKLNKWSYSKSNGIDYYIKIYYHLIKKLKLMLEKTHIYLLNYFLNILHTSKSP